MLTETVADGQAEAPGDFAWGKGEPTASDELLIGVLKDGLCYHATGGFIQLGFPTPQSRGELITALSEHRLWRYAKGGDDDAEGLGAGTWSYSLMSQDAVDALRSLAQDEPAFAALLRLHDALEAAARAMLTETAANGQAEAPSEPRRGDPWRQDNPLQSLVLRLCTPTATPSVMSLTHHRDLYGTMRLGAALPPVHPNPNSYGAPWGLHSLPPVHPNSNSSPNSSFIAHRQVVPPSGEQHGGAAGEQHERAAAWAAMHPRAEVRRVRRARQPAQKRCAEAAALASRCPAARER